MGVGRELNNSLGTLNQYRCDISFLVFFVTFFWITCFLCMIVLLPLQIGNSSLAVLGMIPIKNCVLSENKHLIQESKKQTKPNHQSLEVDCILSGINVIYLILLRLWVI